MAKQLGEKSHSVKSDEHSVLETRVRTIKVINTGGTVINALGLALGLMFLNRDPRIAVVFVVGSIIFYAVTRMVAGVLELKMPVPRHFDGMMGQSQEPGGSMRQTGDFFPNHITYEAKLVRIDRPSEKSD